MPGTAGEHDTLVGVPALSVPSAPPREFDTTRLGGHGGHGGLPPGPEPQRASASGTLLGIPPVTPIAPAAATRPSSTPAPIEAEAPPARTPQERARAVPDAQPNVSAGHAPVETTSDPQTSSGRAPASTAWTAHHPTAPSSQGAETPPPDPTFTTRRRIRGARSGWVLIGLSVLLLLGLGLFSLLAPVSPPMLVTLETRHRAEALRIQCADCPDGTELAFRDQRRFTDDGVATFPLEKPLPIGISKLPLTIDRPNWGRDETLSFELPVYFRITPDLSDIATNSGPTWSIEAVPGAIVRIGAEAHRLSQSAYRYTLPELEEGPRAEPTMGRRTLAYEVELPGRAPQTGTSSVTFPVVPLVLDTPGARTITDQDQLELTGATSPGARVSVGSRVTVADVSGRFRIELPLAAAPPAPASSSPAQQWEVVATLANHGGRRVQLTTTRVTHLALEALRWPRFQDAAGLVGLDAGARVALRGIVTQVHAEGSARQALFQAIDCSTPPCVVRLDHRGPHPLRAGAALRVYGRTTGVKELPDEGTGPLPEVATEFVLDRLR